MPVTDLRTMNKRSLASHLSSLGEPAYRTKQVFSWIHKRLVTSYTDMTDLPLALRNRLANEVNLGVASIRSRICSSDGTAKYLFEFLDGSLVESVLLSHEYGLCVCVSSQVGCKMGCRFCASAIGGFVRNLKSWEIEEQIAGILRERQRAHLPEAGLNSPRVDSVVVMGSGEPLDNFDEVVDFVLLINDEDGLGVGMRHITISTCGLPSRIIDLAKILPKVTVAVSLHAPNDELRDVLMPINKAFPLSELMAACRIATNLTGRRLSFEYALINGVNDGVEHVNELAELIKGLDCHVNLIPYNPVLECGHQSSSEARVSRFKHRLQEFGIAVTQRRELGRDIDAACGQLRQRVVSVDGD